MSQAKVDRYKEEKANRQKIMAKEKREKTAWKVGGYVVVLAIVGWIGFSAYNTFKLPVASQTYELDTAAMDDYMNGLIAE